LEKPSDPKAAALLVEFGAEDRPRSKQHNTSPRDLAINRKVIKPGSSSTRSPKPSSSPWNVREGPWVGGKNRPEGSTSFTEDVLFSAGAFGAGWPTYKNYLQSIGFIPGVAGHAAHGNLLSPQSQNLPWRADGLLPVTRFHGPSSWISSLRNMTALEGTGGGGAGNRPEHGDVRRISRGEKAPPMMWAHNTTARRSHGILAQDVILTRNPQPSPGKIWNILSANRGVTGSSQCIECGFCRTCLSSAMSP